MRSAHLCNSVIPSDREYYQYLRLQVRNMCAIVGGLFTETPKNCEINCRESAKLRKKFLKHYLKNIGSCNTAFNMFKIAYLARALLVSFAFLFSICMIRVENSVRAHVMLHNVQEGCFGLILGVLPSENLLQFIGWDTCTCLSLAMSLRGRKTQCLCLIPIFVKIPWLLNTY